ncbi:hypothetical protein [Lysobacter sp. CFH 32150]|uniref:hypothetical protein n=1 Tax=Lysobacter sp. CFH 32150 TaxID=2927128 RepID=UPI001FA80AEA|nr:hypothetical protein [Lysobacter sp. CFH 32150]MCI4567735.1 hypothetical protein [Lysobacter sp. CFH 32150]
MVYWPGLNGGYVFDDYPNIVDNVRLRVSGASWHEWIAAALSSPASAIQRPLAMLSFALNHYFTGLDPWPMKLTNLAIHGLNTVLVLGLVRSLLTVSSVERSDPRREWAARFAATAWALHPINLMAVLFVVQRMESLSHTFVFAGLWLYLLGRKRQLRGSGGWGLIGSGLLAGTMFGVLAKESATLLPLYALCIELCLLGFRNSSGRRDRRLFTAYALVLALPMVVGLMWLLPLMLTPEAYAGREFTLVQRLLTEPRVVMDYLHWILLPDLGQLSLYHDDYSASRGLLDPSATLFALVALPCLLLAAWLCRRTHPLVSLGLLWFLGAHLLTGTFIPFELVFEHRNYFASLGICLILADLLILAPRSESTQRVGALLAVFFVVLSAGVTHLRAREWSDPVRFAVSEAAKHPHSPRATYDLARVMVMLTHYRPESTFLQPAYEALEKARNVPGSGVLPLQASLMLAARSKGTVDPAWWLELQDKLRRGPIGPQEINALAAMTSCARDRHCDFPPEMMLASYDAALSHRRNPDLLTMYGDYALNVLNDRQLATQLWREVRANYPGVAQYRINLIKLLIATGSWGEARTEIASLRRLGRLGQNENAADELEARLKAAMPGIH